MKQFELGYTFTITKGFPFRDRGEGDKNDIFDIFKAGEKGKIIGYDEEKGLYKILNLSLENENAWFETTEDGLLELLINACEKMDYIFLDIEDERYEENTGKYFVQEGFNEDNKCGEVLGKFDNYNDALSFSKKFGIVVECQISYQSIQP